MTFGVVDLLPPPKYYRMTDACENITFARFAATRAVINLFAWRRPDTIFRHVKFAKRMPGNVGEAQNRSDVEKKY